MFNQPPLDPAGFSWVLLGVGDPAIGANFTSAVTTGVIRQLLSVRFTVTTDAGVPSRRTSLLINNGAVDYLRIIGGGALTASLTWDVIFSLSPFNLSAAATVNFNACSLPDCIYLSDGFTFSSDILNFSAGDAITNIIATYKEWIIPT